VVEAGDHETLMRMGGLYRQLFDTQARGYKPTADGPAPGKNNPASKITARRELHTRIAALAGIASPCHLAREGDASMQVWLGLVHGGTQQLGAMLPGVVLTDRHG
jgi:hypothetical protein